MYSTLNWMTWVTSVGQTILVFFACQFYSHKCCEAASPSCKTSNILLTEDVLLQKIKMKKCLTLLWG